MPRLISKVVCRYIYIYSNCKHSQATVLRAMHVSRKDELDGEKERGFRSCYPSTGGTLRSLIPSIYFSRHERANIPAVYADSLARTRWRASSHIRCRGSKPLVRSIFPSTGSRRIPHILIVRRRKIANAVNHCRYKSR